VPGAIQDQELVLEEKRLRNDGTSAARSEQAGQGRDEVDEKNDQIAHQQNRNRTGNPKELWAKQQFASHMLAEKLSVAELDDPYGGALHSLACRSNAGKHPIEFDRVRKPNDHLVD